LGIRGPHPQPDRPGSRHRHERAQNVVELVAFDGGKVAEPTVPSDYREETKKAWANYWSSDLVQALINPDIAEVEKYFRLFDRWLCMMEVAEREPFTTGSTGQTVLNPALGAAHQLQLAMARLGASLGITPGARQNLRPIATRALTAADINAIATRKVGKRQPPQRRRARIVGEADWEGVE
jgi:P27 family predicted phage terminase small subunit